MSFSSFTWNLKLLHSNECLLVLDYNTWPPPTVCVCVCACICVFFLMSWIIKSTGSLPQQIKSFLCCWGLGPAVKPVLTGFEGPGLPHEISVKQRGDTQVCWKMWVLSKYLNFFTIYRHMPHTCSFTVISKIKWMMIAFSGQVVVCRQCDMIQFGLWTNICTNLNEISHWQENMHTTY